MKSLKHKIYLQLRETGEQSQKSKGSRCKQESFKKVGTAEPFLPFTNLSVASTATHML